MLPGGGGSLPGVPRQSREDEVAKALVQILAQTHSTVGHLEAPPDPHRRAAQRPWGGPYLQHVPRDVLLAAVAADAELGMVVGLAVGQPVPATSQAVRMGGVIPAPQDPQPSPVRGAVALPPPPSDRTTLHAPQAGARPPPSHQPHEEPQRWSHSMDGETEVHRAGATCPAAE